MRQPIFKKSMLLLLLLCCYAVSYAQINAAFTANTTSGCAPLQVTFQNQTTGGNSSNYTYSWNFGVGTSSVQNPTATYTSPGTYSVSLSVTDGNGSDVETRTGYITVHNNPTVDFSGSPLSGCPPLTVNFTDQTTANAPGTSTYSWYFGGTTSSVKNASHIYTTPGLKTITLTVTNSYGCTNTATKNNYVNVSPPPSVSFTADNVNFCSSPATTNFTSSVSGGTPGYTYSWTFGSTAANPPNVSFTGTPPTAFNVGLTVTDANGCQGTSVINNYINIHDPVAGFSAPTSACVGAPVTFTNTSSPNPTGSNWDFGDNTGSVNNSPIHRYNTAGTYTVRYIMDMNGCADTISKQIVIHAKPNVDFTKNPDPPCPAPETIQFNPTNTGLTSFIWDFGDGSATSNASNPNHTYMQNGKYTVTLIAGDGNGCSDTLTKNSFVELYELHAIALSDPDSGCVPLTVKFNGFAHQGTDTSTDPYPYPITAWEWDFDHNGANSSQKNPTYTFTDTGIYNVVLKLTAAGGCTEYDTVEIRVGNKPHASFSVTPTDTICPNEFFVFTNLSTGDTLTAFEWDFGDQTTSREHSPDKRYFLPGCFTVKLRAYSYGCMDDTVKVDSVCVRSGIADFALKYSCDTPRKVSFFDSSIGAHRFEWIFGDGTTNTIDRNPTHIYQSVGNYTATLIIYNDSSLCKDTFSKQLNIVEPTIDLVADDSTICEGQSVQFTATVTGTQVTTGYGWYVNGSLISIGTPNNQFSHSNFREGGNTVLVSIVDEHKCEQTKEVPNFVFQSRPVAKFGADPLMGCVPVNVMFQDSSETTSPQSIVSWQWDFGDGVRTGVNSYDTAWHVYSQRGPYDVKLVIEDDFGCKDSIEIPQVVQPHKPIAAFSFQSPACMEDTIKFSDNSVNAVTYKWYFGDGDSSILDDPWHIYPQTGANSYVPTLIVEDTLGCKDTLVGPNPVVLQKPIADFTMSDSIAVCPPLIVQFDASVSQNATSYEWDLATGNGSFKSNPSEIYIDNKNYTIQLIAKDALGCRDTIEKSVRILGYNGAFSYTPLVGCNPLKVDFDAQINNVAQIIWDFGDGNGTTSTGTTTSHTYTTIGKYVPKVIFEDQNGCKAASTGLDTITVDGVIADIGADAPCENTPVQFRDSSDSPYSPTVAWSWKFQGGQVSAKKDPVIFFGPAGKYTVSLRVENGNGCVDSITEDITIYPPPTVSAGADTIICLDDSATLYPSGALTYLWSPNVNLSCINCTNPKAAPASKTYYTVIGTDGNGCKDTAEVIVDIKTDVTSTIAGGGEICEGDSITLIVSGADTYEWTPANSLSDPTSGNPISTATETTNYMVVAYEGACIPDTNFVKVTVYPQPDIEAKGGQSIVAGTTADLLVTGSGFSSVEWSPASSLNCSDCTAPIASPYETTRYVVTAYSDQGCIDSAFVTVTVACDEKQLFLPNTFTPNGDGQNDVFYPRGAGIEKVVSFKIFNRWGEVVFERSNFAPNDKSFAWDGTYKGTVLPPDTYVYFVQAYCEGDELLKVKGDITIIR